MLANLLTQELNISWTLNPVFFVEILLILIKLSIRPFGPFSTWKNWNELWWADLDSFISVKVTQSPLITEYLTTENLYCFASRGEVACAEPRSKWMSRKESTGFDANCMDTRMMQVVFPSLPFSQYLVFLTFFVSSTGAGDLHLRWSSHRHFVTGPNDQTMDAVRFFHGKCLCAFQNFREAH